MKAMSPREVRVRFVVEIVVAVSTTVGFLWSAFNEQWPALICFAIPSMVVQFRLWTGTWL